MDTLATTAKSVKEITEQFVVKQNYVQKIIGKPTYTSIKPVFDAVNMNLIAMMDDRDNMWGK